MTQARHTLDSIDKIITLHLNALTKHLLHNANNTIIAVYYTIHAFNIIIVVMHLYDIKGRNQYMIALIGVKRKPVN